MIRQIKKMLKQNNTEISPQEKLTHEISYLRFQYENGSISEDEYKAKKDRIGRKYLDI